VETVRHHHPILRWLATGWGLLGVLGLLIRAVIGLAPIAAIPMLDGTLTGLHWLLLIAWVTFMAYAEGYRGFQRRFAPFVAARLLVLHQDPTWIRSMLAPAFCMGLFEATRRRLIVSWSLLIGISLLVLTVRFVPQPWRGLIDAGVVVGLSWGILAVCASTLHVARSGRASVTPELPHTRTAQEGYP
jgi:hypothetical protein